MKDPIPTCTLRTTSEALPAGVLRRASPDHDDRPNDLRITPTTIAPLPDRFVTLATYSTAQDAEVVRGVLEAALIESRIVEELPFESLSRVRLQVLESAAETAAQLLNVNGLVAGAQDAGPDASLPLAEPEACPVCGSPDVHRTRKALRALLLVALALGVGLAVDQTMAAFLVMMAGLAFILFAPRWRCYDCSHAW